MSLKDEFIAIEADERFKAMADKFFEKYEAVVGRESDSRRRWVWELIQNGKDARKGDGLEVEITLSKGGLSFRHNGDPFTPRQLSGLFKQVSDKPSDNSAEDITGKYGTGFITTYLLSRIIHVDGILRPNDGPLRKFSIALNREGKNSEELAPILRRDWEQIIQDSNDDSKFVPVEPQDLSGLGTGYFYPLSDDGVEEVAEDLERLHQTVPYALLFNPKIASITWRDDRHGNYVTYKRVADEARGDDSVIGLEVVTDGASNTRRFLVGGSELFTLGAELSLGDSYSLLPAESEIPTIYRDFPLIGSEEFRFPFVLNSSFFHPQERRDSLFLSSKQEKGIKNREILEAAMTYACEMLGWLAEQGGHKLFACARLKCSDPHWESEVRSWFAEEMVKPFRARLLELPLVETSEGMVEVKGIWIPDRDVQTGPHESYDYWQTCAEILGAGMVPLLDEWWDWFDAMDLNIDKQWNEMQMVYTIDFLLEDIAEKKDLENFDVKGRADSSNAAKTKWLNHVYALCEINGRRGELDRYPVVPNMYGKFHLLKDLYCEIEDAGIPNILLDILKALGHDWRETLIHRSVEIPELSHRARSVAEASDVVSRILGEKEGGSAGEFKFLKRPNGLEICLQILSLNAVDEQLSSLQRFLVGIASRLFEVEESRPSEFVLEGFNPEPAIHQIVRMINLKLEQIGSIEALAELLTQTPDQSTIWLDGYLRKLKESGLLDLSPKAIIPNRLGTFRQIGALHDFGNDEAKLDDDLLRILGLLNPKKDWYPILIGDGIGIHCGRAKTMPELTKEVQDELRFATERKQGGLDEIREGLIEISRWYNTDPKRAQSLMPGINSQVNNVFFLLAMEDKANSDNVLSILRKPENFASLAKIAEANLATEKIEQIAEILTSNSFPALKQLLNDPGRREQIERLLGHANAVEIVDAFMRSDLSLDKVNELLALFPEGVSETIAEYAHLELERRTDFRFKLRIGNMVERALQKVLEQALPDLSVQYVGKGAADFLISKAGDSKLFKLELKSVKPGNIDPVKLTMKQGREAVLSEQGYALMVIERSGEGTELDDTWFRENALFLESPGEIIRKRVEAFGRIEDELNQDDDVMLEFDMKEPKIGIRYRLVKERGKDFATFIASILGFFRAE